MVQEEHNDFPCSIQKGQHLFQSMDACWSCLYSSNGSNRSTRIELDSKNFTKKRSLNVVDRPEKVTDRAISCCLKDLRLCLWLDRPMNLRPNVVTAHYVPIISRPNWLEIAIFWLDQDLSKNVFFTGDSEKHIGKRTGFKCTMSLIFIRVKAEQERDYWVRLSHEMIFDPR